MDKIHRRKPELDSDEGDNGGEVGDDEGDEDYDDG